MVFCFLGLHGHTYVDIIYIFVRHHVPAIGKIIIKKNLAVSDKTTENAWIGTKTSPVFANHLVVCFFPGPC